MTFFWILWGFDCLISLVVLYFFFIGLLDGTVSSYNMVSWTWVLLGLAAIMLGSLWLKSIKWLTLAKILLGILAIPGILYILYALMFIISKPRFN
jgi:hypothetical protein